MAQQPQGEGGLARRIRLQRPRGERPRLPARARRARRFSGRDAQQEGRHAGAFGRQREPAAGRQIKDPRLAPGLDQHGAKGRAARPFRPGAQHAFGLTRPDQQEPGRIEPELVQSRRMQPAGLGIDEILPDPEDRPRHGVFRLLFRRPQRQPERKAGCGGEIAGTGSIDLVQRRPIDPTGKRRVDLRRAEPHPSRRSRPHPQGGLGEAAAQVRQS